MNHLIMMGSRANEIANKELDIYISLINDKELNKALLIWSCFFYGQSIELCLKGILDICKIEYRKEESSIIDILNIIKSLKGNRINDVNNANLFDLLYKLERDKDLLLNISSWKDIQSKEENFDMKILLDYANKAKLISDELVKLFI